MNRRTGFSLAAFAAILLLLASASSTFAQDRDDNDQDPPSRAGRVSYTQGSVSFQPGGEGDWLDAVPNRPLATGDNLWADRDSRAEVQIGSTSIRLGSETSVTLLDLESNVTQLRISAGTLFFRVRHIGSDDAFEVDTPNLAFNVTEPGQYRIDVNENGDQTTATVWRGGAEITGGGSSYRLGDGQQGTFSGVDQLRYDVGEIGRNDDFTSWAMDRDRRMDQSRSAQYVSDEMTGYEDLDEYGHWHNDPEYGNVWAPVNVGGDWAPYRNGHWVYISPWGWTWVEDEPWGFAPFHYGRWAYRGSWFWVPGPVAVVPVYSPALVAFVGGGGFHVGVGIGGGVGWFPLGPGEVYVPWYRTSPRYVERVNITNTRVTNIQVTNVYNNVTVNHVNNVTYINQRQGRGITVVNQQTFVNARPVRSNLIRVDAREMQRAPVTHEVVRDIRPERQSVMGTARPVRFAPPPQVMNRQVVATRQPVMVNRGAPIQGIQGMSRPAPQPQFRKVEAAPRGQAQPLQRGARGSTPGFGSAPRNAGGPVSPDNRGAAPDNRRPTPPMNGVGRPSAPEANNPGNRPGENTPRPGAPQNEPAPGQRGDVRPRGPQNFPANRPNGADNGNPGAQNNNVPVARPNSPDTNGPGGRDNRPATDNRPADNGRPMHNVPRPPSANQDRPQGNPQQNPPDARPNYRNAPPEVRQERPQPNPAPNTPDARPNYRNAPPEVRQDAPQSRPQQPAPVERGVRPEPPAPRPQETRPEPPPQTRRDSTPPPQTRSEAPQRPAETHNVPAPPPRESRPQESRPERGGSPPPDRAHGKEKEKDKDPAKFR
jgi:hypothetical protein